jgi:putative sugar O-methyltransferase
MLDERLRIMLEDMEGAPDLYRPTQFWSFCIQRIVDDLETHGISTFRRHPNATDYFVPVYVPKVYRKFHKTFQRSISFFLRILSLTHKGRRIREILEPDLRSLAEREEEAMADYRIFLAAETDTPPRLSRLSESGFGEPTERFIFDGNAYSRAFLNYLRGLVFLKRSVTIGALRTVMEIGGGYGSLAEILLKCDDANFTYIGIDIPPVGYIATRYLEEVFGKEHVCDYTATRESREIDVNELSEKYRAIMLCPWQLPRLIGSVDLFVNYMSFQEMEPEVVANYAEQVNRLVTGHILLRNSRHGKKVAEKPGRIGVREPVTREHYLEYFKPFELVASESRAFGMKISEVFESEVLVFSRKEG